MQSQILAPYQWFWWKIQSSYDRLLVIRIRTRRYLVKVVDAFFLHIFSFPWEKEEPTS